MYLSMPERDIFCHCSWPGDSSQWIRVESAGCHCVWTELLLLSFTHLFLGWCWLTSASFDFLTPGWTAVLHRVFLCVWVTERVQSGAYECVCVPHTFLCQHNASSCNVYFMLCWPSLHVEPQQPSNIHTAEAHLHIKGPCSAKSTWSEYLSLSVPLSLSPYASCRSLAFQLSALPPLHTHLFVLILFC